MTSAAPTHSVLGQIANRVAAASRFNQRYSQGVKIVGLLGVAVLGLSRLLPAAQAGQAPWSNILGVIGVVVAFVSGVTGLFLDRDKDRDLALAADAIGHVEGLRAELIEARHAGEDADDLAYRQATLTAVASSLRDLVEDVLSNGAGGRPAQSDRLGRVLDILVSHKGDLFRMDDERWNFAIYLFDAEAKLLGCEACRRPTRAEGDAPHRDIPAGAGHVGKVFAMSREAVADDAMKPEYRQMFEMDAAQGGRPDDAEVYRSIASIPIRRPGGNLFGVLVATSNVPGRFWPTALQENRAEFDSVEPLRVCASTLAILLQVINLLTEEKGHGNG
jgi:GAF domain-containing protein